MKVQFILPVYIAFLDFCSVPKTDNQHFSVADDPESVGMSTERLARLDSFIHKKIDDNKLPNMITFIARHAKIVHYKAFGWKDKEKGIKLSKYDIFRNASQTKAVVSVALMSLYEKGYFLLNDPGKEWTYSLSIDVLGYLIEVLSGKPLDQFMRDNILDPIGMNDTYFYLPKEKKTDWCYQIL